jgi:flagellar hook-associated protein 1
MTTLNAILDLARGGLVAQGAGLSVTTENINGASLPGFVRRSPQLEAFLRTSGVAGGVQFKGTERAFDQISSRRLAVEHGLLGSAEARSDALAQSEAILMPGSGVAIDDAVAELFAAFDQLGLKADDPTARQQVVASAEKVASRFRQAGSELAQQRSDLFTQAQAVTSGLNQEISELAALNDKIVQSTQHDGARAEMLDRRDQLVDSISKTIGASVIHNEDDSVTLLSSGSTLVDGNRGSTVQVSLDGAGDLAFAFANGSNATDVTSKVTEGTLGGIAEVRDTNIVQLQADLDQFAFDFATEMNTQHSAGFGLDGLSGRPLFEAVGGGPVPAPPGTAYALDIGAAVAADPDAIAAASTLNGLPGDNDLALSLANLATGQLPGGGTPSERFAALAGSVGTMKNAAEGDLGLRTSTVAHVTSTRESTSGVSLDEEMVALAQYQRAYEASLKVLQTADEMMQTLLQMT